MSKTNEMCMEVLQMTNYGDDLAPKHLFLVELVVNGLTNDKGKAELKRVWQELKKGKYIEWYFDIFGLTLKADGFVLWFGQEVEHFSYLAGNYSEEAKLAAIKLVTRIQHREQKVTSKLHAEGVTMRSGWPAISEVLSKTVSPTHCLETADRLVLRLLLYPDWAGYYDITLTGVGLSYPRTSASAEDSKKLIMREHSYISGGRNVNQQDCCDAPRCFWLAKRTDGDGGWCENPQNRVGPKPGWPDGFTPSVASDGGCDLHKPKL